MTYAEFLEQRKKNQAISRKYISTVGDVRSGEIVDSPYSSNVGDEATEILDIPSLSRDQAAAQASAAAQAAAKALYTGGQNKTPNTLIPGMSYTEWLMKGGMNGQAQKEYDAAVRAAETDYAKTLALYGQNAETLGRAGLTGSGYSDYLTGAGFSAMQGAKVAAADTKALTEAQQRLSYADYLAGVEAQNAQLAAQNAQLAAQENAKQEALAAEQEATAASIKSTIDTAIQQGMDDKAIMAMIQQHYGNQFDQYLGGWIANAHTYNDPLVAQSAQSAADAASAKYREEIFNQLKAGVDPAIVRSNIEYVMKLTGADTSQLDTWMAEAQTAAQPTVDALNAEKTKAETEAAEAAKSEANARQQQANAAYASLIGGDTRYAPAVAERELKNAGYSDDEILAARTNFQANNFDTGANNIEMATTADQLADYSSEALELSVQAGVLSGIQAAQLKQQARAKRAALLEKDFDNVTDENAAAYMQELSNYYKSGDITRDDYAYLMSDVVIANLTGVADENEPMTAAIDMIFALKNSPDYNDIVSDLEKSVVNTMKVVKSIPTTVTGRGTDSVTIEVTFGNNSENKPSTQQLVLETSKKPASVDLGTGNPGDIKAHNGKLYVYDNYKKAWMELEQPYKRYTGSKEHSAEAYKMLVDYYS